MDTSILLPVLFITLLWGTMPVLQKILLDHHGKYNILFLLFYRSHSLPVLQRLALEGHLTNGANDDLDSNDFFCGVCYMLSLVGQYAVCHPHRVIPQCE